MSYSVLTQTQMSYSLLMQTQMSYPLNSVAHLFSLLAVDSLKDFPHCVLLNRVLFVTVVVSPSIAVFLSSLSLFALFVLRFLVSESIRIRTLKNPICTLSASSSL